MKHSQPPSSAFRYWAIPVLCGILFNVQSFGQKKSKDVNELTPSRSFYCSWLNNTWEGPNEQQTKANLNFFKWLHAEYGLHLDIYSFGPGTIDYSSSFWNKGLPKDKTESSYGSFETFQFKTKFSKGFDPLYAQAQEQNTRFGIWLGPDGFGESKDDAQARGRILLKLCKDYQFELFDFDARCSDLRPEKTAEFTELISQCRKAVPGLIVLNHGVTFDESAKGVVTSNMPGNSGRYVDINIWNNQTSVHHRLGNLSDTLSLMQRLSLNDGVCLSSCLDYWDDELVLQAFGRSPVLAPAIYGNPWLLRDDEYAKLARIFNLHEKYNNILIQGIQLPEDQYGPGAVSRGDKRTRFITLRNTGWQTVTYTVKLDKSIGLNTKRNVEVRLLHPAEKIIGKFDISSTVNIEVQPFRACLVMVTDQPDKELGIIGCNYQIVKDLPDQPLEIKLLGMPGTGSTIQLAKDNRRFSKVMYGEQDVSELLKDGSLSVDFSGNILQLPPHRKLGVAEPVSVPQDAETLYETTCFASDNNALEVRSLKRSGDSHIAEVEDARNAFFGQPAFIEKGAWDKYLFDADTSTYFKVNKISGNNKGVFRLDLGKITKMDKLVFINTGKAYTPKSIQISADLRKWITVKNLKKEGNNLVINIPVTSPFRYLRMTNSPLKVSEIEGLLKNKGIDCSNWKASNLFSSYSSHPAVKAWSYKFSLNEVAKNSYLAVAVKGLHGEEGVWAALRVGNTIKGCTDRSISFPTNCIELAVPSTDSSYTYYVPVNEDMINKKMEVVVLGLNKNNAHIQPEVWITTNNPFEEKKLVIFP